MKTVLLIFQDYGNHYYLPLSADDNIDILASFDKAVKDAERDGFRFSSHTVPDNYLSKYGLKRETMDISEHQYHTYGQTPAEQSGIFYATCRGCDSFEDGSCYRYGGICNPDAEADCVHGDNIFKLSYTSDSTNITIYLDLSDADKEEQDISDIMNRIASDPENELAGQICDLQTKEDYDPDLWELEKTI